MKVEAGCNKAYHSLANAWLSSAVEMAVFGRKGWTTFVWNDVVLLWNCLPF